MSDKHLPTEPYKGVRDFYPEDMAIQRYIFDTWAQTAESFGYERYDASVLEPSILYKSKGAENEEMVNEQTYTFPDRSNREVTLRPEMTPTVARMVAGKRRDLVFPLRWYSIPNLFRYERMQRGRLREHWQLNCDLFGADDIAADVEIITLAYKTLIDLGATPEMFEIRLNSRKDMKLWYQSLGINNEDTQTAINRLSDRKSKISAEEFQSSLKNILHAFSNVDYLVQNVECGLGNSSSTMLNYESNTYLILNSLNSLDINNVVIDRSLSRGFDYYTGTVFEIFDVSGKNNRSLLGGGRYDNLTSLFSDEKVSGIGFGMGDVTMRQFLETHNLLKNHIPNYKPQLLILPTTTDLNISAFKLANKFRTKGIKVSVNIGDRKPDKKFIDAKKAGVDFILKFNEMYIQESEFEIQHLGSSKKFTGSISELVSYITQ